MRKAIHTIGLAVAVTGLALAGAQGNVALAKDQGGDKTAAAGDHAKLSHSDRSFIETAAKGGMFEVNAGQLATSRAKDPAVKQLGEQMVKDHQQADDELARLASAKGVNLPKEPGWMQRHELKKLGDLSGERFDHEFAAQAVKDHQKDVKDFEKEAAKVQDADLKAWIDKTLPHLKDHLAAAQKLPEANQQAAGHDRDKNGKS